MIKVTDANTDLQPISTIGTFAFGGFAAFLQIAEDEAYLLVSHFDHGYLVAEHRFQHETGPVNDFSQAKKCFVDLVQEFLGRTSRSMMLDGPVFSELALLLPAAQPVVAD